MSGNVSATRLSMLPIDKLQRGQITPVALEDGALIPGRSVFASDMVLAMDEDAENDEDDDDIYSLPYFQASLFATILEDTITEMRILVDCNSELGLSKALVDLELLRALKYKVAQPLVKDELDGIDVRRLNCVEYKINKLDADRKGLQKSLLDMYLDLSLRRTFQALASHVHIIVDKINHYNFLLEDEAKNRVTRRELARQLRQQRNHIKSVFYDTDCVIEDLKTQVEDAALNSEIRSRYVENWQRARTEQNTQLINTKESRPCNVIEYYKQRSDHEQRVHTEVELLTTIVINETLQKVESWMNKYDKDMEAIELKIQRMKTKHVSQLERRQELEDTLEKHAALIKLWVDFKDERERARLYREKMHNAATVVQAWWRGLLVRNQLGPYKPMPKKGGKPAPAEKPGKKKK
ncbi:dynein regulatory complex protein 9-like isoform X1 [Ostrinia furnacalis]|uniref:dynein regulatory complex protein 9-like isoform X1 n=1 Tax=Ostrinia furnacalis TaxID=93504 RepID=UPI00103980D6|nr:dynein regulatory complex protein 9-like isoform X1 [Ostrinia furnacalis]